MSQTLRSLLTRCATNPRLRSLAFVVYYLVILAGLLALYGAGDFSTPSFIYQGF